MAEHAHTTPGTKPGDTATRRHVLAALAGAAIAGGALAVALPSDATPDDRDAELISACARFCAFEIESRRLLDHWGNVVPDQETAEDLECEKQIDHLSYEQCRLGERLAKTQAHTVAGMRAKARAIATYKEGQPAQDMVSRLADSLVSDLAWDKLS